MALVPSAFADSILRSERTDERRQKNGVNLVGRYRHAVGGARIQRSRVLGQTADNTEAAFPARFRLFGGDHILRLLFHNFQFAGIVPSAATDIVPDFRFLCCRDLYSAVRA